MPLAFVLPVALIVTVIWVSWNLTLDALWQPTDQSTIAQILDNLEIDSGDIVYDLGCGDGRWLTRIVKDYGGKAVGIEIDPGRVIISWMRVLFAGAFGKAKVIWGNMYEQDLSGADSVILFLSEKANEKLAPKLKRELEPGSLIASYYHEMPDWEPVKTERSKEDYDIYIYRIE